MLLRQFFQKNTIFFDYFEQHVALTIEGARELHNIMLNSGELVAKATKIKEIEHKTDIITHHCIEALHRTFITPIDRADIHRLIRHLDDVMDMIDAAASRISLYEIAEIRQEAKELAEVLVRATVEIEQALKGLRTIKNAQAINDRCIAVYQLENEGDVILRSALARLFKEENHPVLIIKWKEIFERLERATDQCETVANIIQGVVIEST